MLPSREMLNTFHLALHYGQYTCADTFKDIGLLLHWAPFLYPWFLSRN